MRIRKPTTRRADDDGVLPLINIIFMLLIFFMLAGRLSAGDPFEVDPPDSSSEQTAAAQENVVLVAADGRIAFGAEIVDEAGLQERVAAMLAETPDERLKLKADGQADADQVVRVMEVLREAGAHKLTLLTAAP